MEARKDAEKGKKKKRKSKPDVSTAPVASPRLKKSTSKAGRAVEG